jgi:GTPase SAR1 family protein
VFDSSQSHSFHDLNYWYEFTQDRLAEHGREKKVAWTLAGNKVDLVNSSPQQRVVDHQSAREWAGARGMDFVETSALDGQNVDIVFQNSIEKVEFLTWTVFAS